MTNKAIKEIKWNNKQCSINPRQTGKKETKKKKKEPRKIKNQLSMWILIPKYKNHFKCNWSKHTS